MKALRLAAFFALLLPSAWLPAALPPDFRVLMVTQNYPPLVMSGSDSHFARGPELKGISVDFVREMFKRAGIGYDITMRYPFSRIYDMVQRSSGSAIFPVEYSENRKSAFKWVGPLDQANLVLVGKKGKDYAVGSSNDIAAYPVGAYTRSGAAEYLAEQGIPCVESIGPEKTLENLLSDQVALWAVSEPEFRHLTKKKGITDLQVVKVLRNQSYYLAFNLDTPSDAVRRLQHALDFMRQDGTLARIAESYAKDHMVSSTR